MVSFFRISPRFFTALSLVLVALMVAITGLVQSSFFRQAIIDREGKVISDFAHALASREITWKDFQDYSTESAREHFSRSFGILRDIGEVKRIKVFDMSGKIVWSDEPGLIGLVASHSDNVSQVASSGSAVVFYDEKDEVTAPDSQDPSTPFVEFFVPIFLHKTQISRPEIAGVMALYWSPVYLDATLNRGVQLVWMVTAIGGIMLYGALFVLFTSVWKGRERAENKLMRLSVEQQRLIHLEKLSATGALVSEIAHQINNPLVGVINLAELAEREVDDPVRTKVLLEDIRHAGEHCRDFVRRMLDFTKAARCELQPVSLTSLIADTVSLFRDSTPGHPVIEVRLPDDSPRILADPVLVRHALFNLLSNAFQAAGQSPIEVRLKAKTNPTTDQKGWILEVLDQGPGIPEPERKRIFTPFFTTKPGGMGLGLAVVEHIAIQHGGEVSVTDAPGGGARFLLWFPENVLAGAVV